MSLKEHVYSVLVVSSAENFNASLSTLLPISAYDPVHTVSDVSAAKRELSERAFDFVLINAPLPDESGMRFAIDVSTSSNAVVLLLIRNDMHDEIYDKVAQHGVFTLPKPASKPAMALALHWMASARERMRRFEKKTLSIEEKMDQIRTVNRAKWLLIENLNLSEPDAHRYIEKQSMDRCVPKQQIAWEIIRTYS